MTPNQDDRIGVPKDELEFEAVEVNPPKRHWGRWLSILIILIVAVGAGWKYLGDQINLEQQKGVPVVRAEVTPIKIKPADPGGLDVPNRDKLVYDRLNGGSTNTEVESLLPPPEEPIEMPVSVASDMPVVSEETVPAKLEPLSEMEPATITSEVQAPVALEPTTMPVLSSTAPEAPPPPPVPVVTVEAAELVAPPAPEPTPLPAAAPATPAPTIVASANGQFRIQLAALRTHGSAASEWKRLKNAHPAILGPLTLFVVMVDLGGDQGVYYRLRAGNLATKDAAKAVCGKLAVRNVACLVIRPGK